MHTSTTLTNYWNGAVKIWNTLSHYSINGTPFILQKRHLKNNNNWFISLQAEEQYIASLERIERVPPVPEPEAPYQKSKFFGDAQSTFQHAVAQYELSLSRATAFRRELVKTMRTQIQVLQNVKVSRLVKFTEETRKYWTFYRRTKKTGAKRSRILWVKRIRTI